MSENDRSKGDLEEQVAAEEEVDVEEGIDKAEAEAKAGEQDDDEGDEDDGREGSGKPRRRKYAVWVAYVGAGYHGMQRNPGFPSIEEELERALVKAGAIPEHLAGDFVGVKWSRSARTDKGVSAVCQVVSAKIFVDPVATFPERVNAHLPGQIRILGVTRVTEGFNSRMYCDKRRYEYILPTWVFDPAVGRGRSAEDVAAGRLRRELAQEQKQRRAAAAAGAAAGGEQQGQQQDGEGGGDGNGSGADGGDGGGGGGNDDGNGGGGGGDGNSGGGGTLGAFGTGGGKIWGSDKLQRLRADVARSMYEFTEDERARLNALLAQYCGTHNFHNYTVKVEAYSNEALRYILAYECPGTVEIRGQKWARLVVLGQSFMLHQIRKMVGMAVAVMRGAAPEGCLAAALDPDRDFNVPIAPELGLFLDEAFFDAYNRRYGEVHGPMTLDAFREAAEEFKTKHVYEQMAERDETEMVNAAWIRTLHNEPTFRFASWEAAPKVRQVKRKWQEQSRSLAKGGPRGRGKRSGAQVEDKLTDEQLAAKRAALTVPVAALAAQRQQQEQQHKQEEKQQQLAEPDELDALY